MSHRQKGKHKPRHHTHAVKPDNLVKKKLPPLGWADALEAPTVAPQTEQGETAEPSAEPIPA